MFFRTPEEKLLGIKKIKIKGVPFTIKKINVLDYAEGYKVLVNLYDNWNNKKANENLALGEKKTKELYEDIFVSGVVKPKLSKKQDGLNIYVGEIFNDWEMAHMLFAEIMANTLKKKVYRQLTSQLKKQQKSTS